jgi:histone acetyltransferase (RNA polymerase elongator complex component)
MRPPDRWPSTVFSHGTTLANQWRRGDYRPLELEEYVAIAADLIELTPWDVVYHRVTGTAPENLLLAPGWCSGKWPVVNAIVAELVRRGSRQGGKARTVDGEWGCRARTGGPCAQTRSGPTALEGMGLPSSVSRS